VMLFKGVMKRKSLMMVGPFHREMLDLPRRPKLFS